MLAALRDQLPKVLVGLLIPAVQWLWKYFRDRDVAIKKDRLRGRVAELGSQRPIFAALEQNPQNLAALTDLDAELSATLATLATLGTPQKHHPQTKIERSRMARALLLYTPTGLVSWILHLLFFLNISFVAFGIIGVFADPDPDMIYGLLGMGFLSLPIELWRRLAIARDQKEDSDSVVVASGSAPRQRRRWIPTILFWLALVYAPFGAIGPFLDDPAGFSLANAKETVPFSLAFVGYFACLAVCARGWATAPRLSAASSVTGVRGFFLLYRPASPTGWFATLCFWIGIGYLLESLNLLKGLIRYSDEDGPWVPIVTVGCSVLLIVAAKKWAAQYRPVAHPSPIVKDLRRFR